MCLFGCDFENEIIQHKTTNQFFQICNQIVTESPNIIKQRQNQKLYIDENRIHQVAKGAYLLLDNGESAYLPYLLTDILGPYLPASYEQIAKKPFKCICNDCHFEWEGGVFTMRCPNCNSRNIQQNVPNW